jgi:hypothetical protein
LTLVSDPTAAGAEVLVHSHHLLQSLLMDPTLLHRSLVTVVQALACEYEEHIVVSASAEIDGAVAARGYELDVLLVTRVPEAQRKVGDVPRGMRDSRRTRGTTPHCRLQGVFI